MPKFKKRLSFLPIIIGLGVLSFLAIYLYFFKGLTFSGTLLGTCPKPKGEILDEGLIVLDTSTGWKNEGIWTVYENLTITKGDGLVGCIKSENNVGFSLARFEIGGTWGNEGLAKNSPIFFVSGNKLFKTERFLSGKAEKYPQLYQKPITISSELVATEISPIEKLEPFFYNSISDADFVSDYSNPRDLVLYVSRLESGLPVTVIGETYDIESCNLRKEGWNFLSFSGETPVIDKGQGFQLEITDLKTAKKVTRLVTMKEIFKELVEKGCSSY